MGLISKEINANNNRFIAENYDRFFPILPIGTKALLRRKFAEDGEGMTLNKYFNMLVDLDLRGKVDWSEGDEGFRVLREMAANEKG